MKCANCGGRLTLEEEFCPHCGSLNMQARQHARDMKIYQKEFEETREDVYKATKKYKKTSVQVTLIAILLIVIVVVNLLTRNIYSILWDYKQQKAEENYQEYAQILDEYLENEEYEKFQAFCAEKNIFTYEGKYEKYEAIEETANNYKRFCSYLMGILTIDDFYEWELEQMIEYLNRFYDSMDEERYRYSEEIDWEQTRKAFATMKQNVEMMLMTYCDFTEEEVQELVAANEFQRGAMIEEALNLEEELD